MPRPARPWFRFYSEQLESRKAQALRRELPVVYGTWVNVLCIANVQKVRGTLPTVEDIAFALRPDPEDQVTNAIEVLIDRKFIDKKGARLLIHNWKEWQRDSDVNKSPGRENRHELGTPMERGRNAVGTRNTRGRNDVGTPRSEEIKNKKEIRGEETRARDPLDQLVADFAAFGAVTQGTSQAVEYAVKDYGLEAVQQAVRTAAGASFEGTPPWSYVESILKREPDGPRAPKRNGGNAPRQLTDAEEAEHERIGLNRRPEYVPNPNRAGNGS